ncbi:MAG: molybdenum ABC transporter ATP-binding protein [Gemmatimonadetes bacterium]|nr:molybdenum ABC transporter ATP-binding protein [Gemmatimonadota bacterium]
MLEARVALSRGDFSLDAELELPALGVTGLFGPSGSGKTTLLRCLAGLERAPGGRVRLGGSVWQDDAAGVFVPPHRRRVGFVFQEADLFSHLSVRDNLRYAAKRARGAGTDAPAVATPTWDEAVAWLGVGPLLDRDPGRLSGGERQRVAVARALLAAPRLLLMDEPLAALDEPGRREILPYLEALPARLAIPLMYVSHELREVTRLSDRMVWLVGGCVAASGTPAEVLSRTDFARWRGDAAGVVVDAALLEHDDVYELSRVASPWGPLWIRRHDGTEGSALRVEVRAGDVVVGLRREEDTSVLNQLPVRVVELGEGERGEVLARLGPRQGEGPHLLARLTRRSRDALGLEPGRDVVARIKSVAVVE